MTRDSNNNFSKGQFGASEEYLLSLLTPPEPIALMSVGDVEAELRKLGLDPDEPLSPEISELIDFRGAKFTEDQKPTPIWRSLGQKWGGASRKIVQAGHLDDLIWLIEPFFRNVWSAVVATFERLPARIGVSAVFLVAAVITGNFYVDRTRQYQEIVSTTVRAEGEGAPQRFNVLEAFIMSTINPRLTERIKNATISDEFKKHLQKMHEALSEPKPLAELTGGDPPNHELGVKLSIPDRVDSARSLPLQNAILTDNAPDGFLVFPLNLLRTRLEGNYQRIFDESRRNSYSRTLAAAVAADSAVADDIAISRNLTPVMRSLTRAQLFKNDNELEQLWADVRPVRVYYITKNDVNRQVDDANPEEQKFVYRNMFGAATFFPSRPYYVGAFNSLKTDKPATLDNITGATNDSFYVSQPYLDLGGFGVVITLARAVSYPGHSDAAICFDLRVKLENPIAFQLKERLEAFGATHREVKCRIGIQSAIECGPRVEGGVDFGLKQKLENRLTGAMNARDLSTVVGNISILDDQTMREGVSQTGFLAFLKYPVEIIFGYNSRPITFAIPLDLPGTNDGRALEARFMVSSLNLERFQQITSLLGLTSVSLLALAFFVVLLSWRDKMRTRRNYEETFKTVDGVLYGAPTPYCRLSARDTVVDCNTAFCDLLKMPADSESVMLIKGRTFESLVAPRSKATYHDVQQRRRAGQDVAPYTLYFTRVDGSEVETQVVSGILPVRMPRELPETFGIVIPS
jgi:PAS domain-containing protein